MILSKLPLNLASTYIGLLFFPLALLLLSCYDSAAVNRDMLQSSRTVSSMILSNDFTTSLEQAIAANGVKEQGLSLQLVMVLLPHLDYMNGSATIIVGDDSPTSFAQVVLQWCHLLSQRGDSISALSCYNAVHLVQPKWGDPLFLVASIFLSESDFATAVKFYEQALQSTEFSRIGKGDIYLKLGEVYRTLDNHQDARLALQNSVDEGFSNSSSASQAWYLLGMEDWNAGENLSVVRSRFEHSLELNPSHYWSLYTLGRLQVAAEEYGLAEDLFRRAVTVNPSEMSAYEALVMLFLQNREVVDACNLLRRLPPILSASVLQEKYASQCTG